MPSKNTKKTRRAQGKFNQAPQIKDDGSRWIVVRHGKPVYPSHKGSTRQEAERLLQGLLEPAEILKIA